jgi:preprotein translocase subunit SecD
MGRKNKMAKIGWRVWLLIAILALSLLAIKPSFETGVLIKSVEKNSTASNIGLKAGQIIKEIDGTPIEDIQDYSSSVGKFPIQNKTKLIIKTQEQEFVLFTNSSPEITVKEIPPTRIKFGLDLEGGSRALVKPEKELSQNEIQDLLSITTERLNVYGLSDISVRPVTDLEGKNFILVEIAGATPDELEELIAKQGKFEAKIGNETVFVGGKNDITFVERAGENSGIYSCQEVQGGYACNFRFSISLSEKAAQKHAEITSKLGINSTQQGRYLDKKLDLYLDDKLVSSLFISSDLKGRPETKILIQGGETGETREKAIENSKTEMKKLQTVLITGSLPFKLEIVKLDTISPLLGEKFLRTIIFAGVAAIFAVAVVVAIRYRKLKSSLALLLTSFSEVIIILGIASLVNWNLDLPSIAGILAVIGTGVDQQIVILDESHSGKQLSIKQRLKRALFIIISAYFTSLVALMPLYWAGAGLLKGFAVTTIIGITAAVLITRPAFADIIKKIEQ